MQKKKKNKRMANEIYGFGELAVQCSLFHIFCNFFPSLPCIAMQNAVNPIFKPNNKMCFALTLDYLTFDAQTFSSSRSSSFTDSDWHVFCFSFSIIFNISQIFTLKQKESEIKSICFFA